MAKVGRRDHIYPALNRQDRDGRPRGAPGRDTGTESAALIPKGHVVSVDALLNISDSARQAFGAFDWTEHAGKGVRLFVQGFG